MKRSDMDPTKVYAIRVGHNTYAGQVLDPGRPGSKVLVAIGDDCWHADRDRMGMILRAFIDGGSKTTERLVSTSDLLGEWATHTRDRFVEIDARVARRSADEAAARVAAEARRARVMACAEVIGMREGSESRGQFNPETPAEGLARLHADRPYDHEIETLVEVYEAWQRDRDRLLAEVRFGQGVLL